MDTFNPEELLTDLARSPPHVSGLNQKSVIDFLYNDISQILLPTITVKRTVGLNSSKKLDSDRFFPVIINHRLQLLTKFLQKVAVTVSGSGLTAPGEDVLFESTVGDSHNGGQRALFMNLKSGRYVLKFSDPRPYKVLTAVLTEISKGLGHDLIPPAITPLSNEAGYFIRYIDPDHSPANIEHFMYGAGAVTAVAFSLGMVDLHFENVIACDSKPIIIDPECIFYNFDRDSISERLLSTGLLSHAPRYSALRGGNYTGTTLHEIEIHSGNDGLLRYLRPMRGARNLISDTTGKSIDAAQYEDVVIQGYADTYTWITKNRDKLIGILLENVSASFRIRFLLRKTRHYLSVIHMLNLPHASDYSVWVNSVLRQFTESGCFSESVGSSLTAAEIYDLESRDIPFFWIEAGSRIVHHHTNSSCSIDLELTPLERTIDDIHRMHEKDLQSHLSVLSEFMKHDLIKDLPVS